MAFSRSFVFMNIAGCTFIFCETGHGKRDKGYGFRVQFWGFDAGFRTPSPQPRAPCSRPLDDDAVVLSVVQGNRDDLKFGTAGDQRADMAAPHGLQPD